MPNSYTFHTKVLAESDCFFLGFILMTDHARNNNLNQNEILIFCEFLRLYLTGFKPGERIESASFLLCSERWSIWLCPGGKTGVTEMKIQLFLIIGDLQ